MLTIIAFLFLLIVLDIAAMRWGIISSDGPESQEWERRQQRSWPRHTSASFITNHKSAVTTFTPYTRQTVKSRKVQASSQMAPQC